MPLTGHRVPEDAVKILDVLLAEAATQYGPYSVISVADVNAMLGREAMRDAMGCDTVECSAQIGGALGVRYLLSGTVSRLGSQFFVALSVIDTSKQQVQTRARFRCKNDEDLYAWAVDNAVRKLFGLVPKPTPSDHGNSSSGATGRSLDASAKPWRDLGVSKELWTEYDIYCKAAASASADCYQFKVWNEGDARTKEAYLRYFNHRSKILDDGGRPEEFSAWFESTYLGTIHISTEPSEAAIALDGQNVGISPGILRALEPGSYQLQISADGFATWQREVVISAAEVVEIEATLIPSGGIVLLSPHPGVSYFFGGQEHAGPTLKVSDLAPGEYEVGAQAPGRLEERRTVIVEPATVHEINFSLLPPGQLRVVSVPPGAEVQVDGADLGTAPASLYVREPGELLVRVRKAGHDEHLAHVVAAPNQKVQITVTLEPESAAQARRGRRWAATCGFVVGLGAALGARFTRASEQDIEENEYGTYLAAENPTDASAARTDLENARKDSNRLRVVEVVAWGAALVLGGWAGVEWLPSDFDGPTIHVSPIESGTGLAVGGSF